MDLETFTENNKVYPYCICLLFYSKNISFWYSEDFVADFLSYISENAEGSEVEIYTHNINFDGLIIVDFIKNKNIHFDMYIREQNVYWIKILYLKVVIKIRCSYKIIPLSVSNLGFMLNDPKKVFPYKFVNRNNLDYVGDVPSCSYFNSNTDYELFKKQNSYFDLKSTAIAYCFQDIKIIAVVLEKVFEILVHYSGGFYLIKSSFSFSSISYKIFSKKYDVHKITKTKNTLFLTEYIRNSYYGGRCEVFGNPRDLEIVHYFDYKGMYSQCMLEKFPLGNPELKKKNLSISNVGFHTIRFKCNDYLPFLPVRDRKLFFPKGEFIGTYWYEEVLNALKYKKCEVVEVYSSLEYPKEDFVFEKYVNEFIKIRNKGVYYNLLGKNMVNGLYGSFALREDNEIYVVCTNQSELDGYLSKTNVLSFKKIGNVYVVKISKDFKSRKLLDKGKVWDLDYSARNVAYASVIAAKARIKLNNSLNRVIEDGGRILYSDTDSIFASYSKNKLNECLGDVKWSKVYEDAVFVSSKFYFLKGDDIKLKGVNNNPYSFDDIKNKFYSNQSNLVFLNQISFPKSTYEIFEFFGEKKINTIGYDKRLFSSDKKETTPVSIQTNNVYK